MKSNQSAIVILCLFMPFALTFVNLLIVTFVFLPTRAVSQTTHSSSHGILHSRENIEVDVLPAGDIRAIQLSPATDDFQDRYDPLSTSETLVAPVNNVLAKLASVYDSDEQNDDPMLRSFPELPPDFRAYVRADISSFYNRLPNSDLSGVQLKEQIPQFTGQACKFVNLSPVSMSLYWDGPEEPVFNSLIGPWGSGGTACFATHRFFLLNETNEGTVPTWSSAWSQFTVTGETSVYFYDPYEEEVGYESFTESTDSARGIVVVHESSATRNETDVSRNQFVPWKNLTEKDRMNYHAHRFNLEFGKLYKNVTGGSEWLAMYPPVKPKHFMWRADFFGQTHSVQTMETQFIKPFPESVEKRGSRLSVKEMRQSSNESNGSLPWAEYRDTENQYLNLTLKAVSCAPRAFEIRNFLSDIEVDHLLHLVNQMSLTRSTTGRDASEGHVSTTRTSRTTWLSRETDPIVNVIFRRAAHVLRIPEALLRNRDGEDNNDQLNVAHSEPINEMLQVVHYAKGQQYTAHHDFAYPKEAPDRPHKTRSINFCLYLNDVPSGGQTSFPRWRNAETTGSLDVQPEKGKAMIFYMINPDGNLDDLTQHAALPVLEGEKYFVNLWISSY
jgi:prolyl 4-hydroxylase